MINPVRSARAASSGAQRRGSAWSSALEAWETVLALQPDHPRALGQRLECLIHLRRFDEALQAYRGAEPLLGAAELLHLARKLMSGAAYREALPVWETLAGKAGETETLLNAIRGQLRCFTALGLTGRRPVVDAATEAASRAGRMRARNAGPRQIAILGVSYCGSTLLSLVLGAAPGVANIGESHWLQEPRGNKDANAYQLDGQGFEQCVFCGPSCPVINHGLRARLAARPLHFYETVAEALGTDVLVTADKNYPHGVRRDPGLHNDALVLFREPLGNWRSHARRTGESTPEQQAAYLDKWAGDYANFLDNYTNSGLKLVVDFDAFLAAPEAMLQALGEALRLPVTPACLDYWQVPQHCIGGNLDVRRHLETGTLDALRIAPKGLPAAATDRSALAAPVRALYERLQSVALRPR